MVASFFHQVGTGVKTEYNFNKYYNKGITDKLNPIIFLYI